MEWIQSLGRLEPLFRADAVEYRDLRIVWFDGYLEHPTALVPGDDLAEHTARFAEEWDRHESLIESVIKNDGGGRHRTMTIGGTCVVNNCERRRQVIFLGDRRAAERFRDLAVVASNIVVQAPELTLYSDRRHIECGIPWYEFLFMQAWNSEETSSVFAQRCDAAGSFYSVLRVNPFFASAEAIHQMQPATHDDDLYSKPDTPSRWAKQWGCHRDTWIARVKNGTIRARRISDRSYQVHINELRALERATSPNKSE